MHKLNKKSKRAFTLLEMVLVVAIIVILAAALIGNVFDILNTGHRADNAVKEGSERLENSINESEQKLSEYGFGGTV